MRPLVWTFWHKQASLGIDEPRDGIRHAATGDQQAVIVIDRNQTAIKHPVDGAGECEAVADTIGAVVGNRADMCRLNLGTAAAIDQLEARDGAGVLIGRLDRYGKRPVPERTLHDLSDDLAVDAVDLVWHLRIVTEAEARFFGWIGRRTFPIPLAEHMCEAGSQDRIVFLIGMLRTARPNAPLFVEPSFLRRPIS